MMLLLCWIAGLVVCVCIHVFQNHGTYDVYDIWGIGDDIEILLGVWIGSVCICILGVLCSRQTRTMALTLFASLDLFPGGVIPAVILCSGRVDQGATRSIYTSQSIY